MKLLTATLIATTVLWTSVSQAFFGIPMKHMRQIEQGILKAVEKKLAQDGLGEYKVTDFAVDWRQNSFKCVEGEGTELSPDLQVGACVVTARANGLKTVAAIAKKDTGYTMTLLYLEVE